MYLKASTDYGLRALLYLASQGTTCSSRDIADAMEVPRDYLIQIAQQLRNAGLIAARPGKNGGYRLAKDPSDITLLEIVEALSDDGAFTHRGASKQNEMLGAADDNPNVKLVKKACDLVIHSYDAYLNSISIQTILLCTQNSRQSDIILAKCLNDESRRLVRGKQGLVNAMYQHSKEGRSLPEEKQLNRDRLGMSEESRRLLREQRIAM